jgi:AraC-type DNA-binding domain-containing proteins
MIEEINGIREIVNYKDNLKLKVYLNKEREDYPQHWHIAAEIIMPLEDTYTAIINENEYILKPNDILVIPPGEIHQLKAPSKGSRVIIQFDGTMLNDISEFISIFQSFRPCVVVTGETMPEVHKELKELIMEITSEYFSEMPYKDAAAYSLLIRIFAILGRKYANRNEAVMKGRTRKQHEYFDRFFNVCQYINEHCTENIKIDDIAAIAGFSKYHFTRLFKEIMNVSCYDYLTNRRIMYAEQLLIEPDLTIMQVAMKSGFSSLATFNRVFRAKNHCTPSEYKAMYDLK